VSRAGAVAICVAVAVALAAAACAPRETGVQRVTRIRRSFRIEPNGFQVRTAADGTPEVVVSVLVVNGGRDSLERLTLRVHLQGADGRDRASGLAALDTSELVPGVTSQLTGIARQLEVAEGESVLLELEDEPARESLAGYAEYGEALRVSR
jgi:hypothetical protein